MPDIKHGRKGKRRHLDVNSSPIVPVVAQPLVLLRYAPGTMLCDALECALNLAKKLEMSLDVCFNNVLIPVCQHDDFNLIFERYCVRSGVSLKEEFEYHG